MYRTILVPTDGSEGATAAVDHAVDLADAYGTAIHALYVADVRMAPVTEEMGPEEIRGLHDRDPTEAVADRAEAAGIDCIRTLRVGIPHEEITGYADDAGADVIVMGTHGRTGPPRYLLGSTTERVLRTADRPVMAVPREGDQS